MLYRPKAHLHDMVSLISNWFILGPTERSLNSCSVIAAQPTSLPHPIFIQMDMYYYSSGLRVSYMDIYKLTSSTHDWNTWQYYHPNQLTHLYTSGLQVGIPTTSLCTPLNPSMFSSITFMPKKCGLQNKKKILFMLHITLQSLQ